MSAAAARLGKRYALAAFVAFAAAYVLLSTWEIVAGVFGLDAPGGPAARGHASAACVSALRRYVDASVSGDENASRMADAEAACGAESADEDAYAAARRFVRAAESLRLDRTRIAPLRRDIDAYLGP